VTWRAIRSTIPLSESLARLSADGRWLYFYMLSQTDAWGAVEDVEAATREGLAAKIRARCAPLIQISNAKVGDALEEMVGVGRAALYGADGKWYVALPEFDENQPKELIRRRGQPRVPLPDYSGTTPGVSGSTSAQEVEKEKEEKAAKAASSAKSPTADDVRTVYEVWRTERGKTDRRYATASETRRTKIRSRLREFTVDELVRAIRAVALDPWEDRPRHDDLTVIFRSREQVERFLAFADERRQVANGQGNVRTQQHLERLKAEGRL
jgi:hypothetical protein